MLQNFDPASLSDEAREGLAQLIGAPDDSPTEDATEPVAGQEAPPEEARPIRAARMPAWAKELVDQNKQLQALVTTLEASNRTVQGQARALESRLGQIAAQRARPESDGLDNVDMTDPQLAALVNVVKAQHQRLEQLGGFAERQTMTEQEQVMRQQWLDWQQDLATDLDVDWSAIEPQLRGMPINDLAVKGKKLITAAAKGKAAVSSDALEAARREGAITLAKQLGIYNDLQRVTGRESGANWKSLPAEDKIRLGLEEERKQRR